MAKLRDNSRYAKYRITRPLDAEERSFGTKNEIFYYESHIHPASQGKSPLVFLYPGFVGVTPFEHHIARYFADRGVSVVISHYISSKFFSNFDVAYRQTVLGTKMAFSLIDFLSTRPEVDAERLGVIGISYGGIRALYHTALDTRIKAAALVVIGGPVSEIIGRSEHWLIRAIREKQMQAAGITNEAAFIDYMNAKIDIKLEDVLCQRQNSDFFLYIAESDEVIPPSNQWDLWDLLGQPQYETMNRLHIPAALEVGLTRLSQIHSFFTGRWDS